MESLKNVFSVGLFLWRVEFRRLRVMRVYRGLGKTWVIRTDAFLYRNHREVASASVFLHANDEDNPALGVLAAAKKVITKENIPLAVTRACIFSRILRNIDTKTGELNKVNPKIKEI